MNKLTTVFFGNASDFIASLPELDKAKVLATISAMELDMSVAHIKLLRTPIRELIVKKYRLLFFVKKEIIHFTNGFIKKSQKTPKHEIDFAEKIFKEYEKIQ